jgi:hypothetical protein
MLLEPLDGGFVGKVLSLHIGASSEFDQQAAYIPEMAHLLHGHPEQTIVPAWGALPLNPSGAA